MQQRTPTGTKKKYWDEEVLEAIELYNTAGSKLRSPQRNFWLDQCAELKRQRDHLWSTKICPALSKIVEVVCFKLKVKPPTEVLHDLMADLSTSTIARFDRKKIAPGTLGMSFFQEKIYWTLHQWRARDPRYTELSSSQSIRHAVPVDPHVLSRLCEAQEQDDD